MSHRQKALLHTVIALCAAFAGLLLAPAPASAQVSIVPDQVDGGGTHTFAFRLADGKPGTATTRLELTFPPDPPVAYVKVDPVPGWTVTVTPRPLDPPVQAGDRTVSEVAASLVLDGGSVRPGEFEQFLVTLGPLPGDGRLTFEAKQTFADGTVAQWGATTAPAPVITLGSGAVAGAAGTPGAVAKGEAAASPAPANQAARTEMVSSTGFPYSVLWGALVLAAVVIGVVWLRARRKAGAE
ncbi:DUF1775 domain-containing protein [Amycolatopsis acidicola]|uniref:DUF1775 domain-containing protein n=1 Tax=Amycolatopsis acidicola TaxID=2596893 RepID=A0A5N0UZR7_9PSEU|nr:DUF1775 domain-containing protein [Amycolatopsis acidicola]KAA9155640.1 DUF1775 domain-containing protein [Amycolatopsis acidicola]